ncbi:MAG: AAA family ATPase [Nitrososphaerota archaeon]|nr:AAA family ATPase [Nitrososphaerota archaeon]
MPIINDRRDLRGLMVPVAALAVELSTPEWMMHDDTVAVSSVVLKGSIKSEHEACFTLETGVFVLIFAKRALYESVLSAAATSERIHLDCAGREWETRIGIVHGLVNGEGADKSIVVRMAERFARAAQPGQTLTTFAVSKELRQGWDFAPVGVVPRRKDDKVVDCLELKGRKTPVATPSAIAEDNGSKMIGREAELDVISTELEKVIQTCKTRWLAIVAPAGGGKSKLVRTWIAKIKGDDRIDVLGAASSPFGAQPFSVIKELLRALGEDADFDSSPGRTSTILAKALRERSCKVNKALVLVIEDIHWADQESLWTIQSLVPSNLAKCLVIAVLRTFFRNSCPWLENRKVKCLLLDGLDPEEIRSLATYLLPDSKFQNARERLVSSPQAANPLYLEQCAAYIRESGERERLPLTLHEAVLKRLELLSRSMSDTSFHRLEFEAKAWIDDIEARVGEWLDRLETDDYEGRQAIAEYLGILQNIDAQLVILQSIHSVPLLRNRRLAAATDRFYSATFSENAEAIKVLSERNPVSAAYAVERGAYRAAEDLRLGDLIEYLKLEQTYTTERLRRAKVLIQLGDAYVCSGCLDDARHSYSLALEYSQGDATLVSRCEQRLGHQAVLIQNWKTALKMLEKAKGLEDGDETFEAECDTASALAALGRESESEKKLQEISCKLDTDDAVSSALRFHRLLKTKLQIALAKPKDKFKIDPRTSELLVQYANHFAFTNGTLGEIADFASTVKLAQSLKRRAIGINLTQEVHCAEAKLWNHSQ